MHFMCEDTVCVAGRAHRRRVQIPQITPGQCVSIFVFEPSEATMHTVHVSNIMRKAGCQHVHDTFVYDQQHFSHHSFSQPGMHSRRVQTPCNGINMLVQTSLTLVDLHGSTGYRQDTTGESWENQTPHYVVMHVCLNQNGT
jgi:hypothetical protein